MMFVMHFLGNFEKNFSLYSSSGLRLGRIKKRFFGAAFLIHIKSDIFIVNTFGENKLKFCFYN